ncbi:hypothetical protein ZWY2020_003859 [Hordeum vulgare]|nr:hypothetical protein ZWY2020_003859 [Hordeum vulgare]
MGGKGFRLATAPRAARHRRHHRRRRPKGSEGRDTGTQGAANVGRNQRRWANQDLAKRPGVQTASTPRRTARPDRCPQAPLDLSHPKTMADDPTATASGRATQPKRGEDVGG